MEVKNISNTQLRIVSAVAMAFIVLVAFLIGKGALLALVGLVGVLVLDEFIVNFLSRSRQSASYFLAMGSFLLAYVYLNAMEGGSPFFLAFNNAGILLNVGLLLYLFTSKVNSNFFKKYIASYSFLMGAVLLVPFMNLSALAHAENWRGLLAVLAVLNFSVDTGAWFFGKKFGKRKLWPSVSPKKTVEGFVGGIISSVLITGLLWLLIFGAPTLQMLFAFLIIACCSQLGDLVQSKMKRQFEIKDSSNLIPGHGGMYDRVDSLLFVAPLYLFMIRFLV